MITSLGTGMHADSSVIRPSTAGNPWSPIARVMASISEFSTSSGYQWLPGGNRAIASSRQRRSRWRIVHEERGPGRRDRWRRRWRQHRVPPRAARLEGRRARRAVRPHLRIDLALGRTRRSAALVGQPHADDDVLGRPVRGPAARDGQGPRLARGRRPAPRVESRPHGRAPPPGGLGRDVRAAARAHHGLGRARAVPADVARGRPRSRLAAAGRLSRSEPAHVRARGRSAALRRRDRHAYPGDRHHAPRTVACTRS